MIWPPITRSLPSIFLATDRHRLITTMPIWSRRDGFWATLEGRASTSGIPWGAGSPCIRRWTIRTRLRAWS